MKQAKNRVALVTGASRNIGRAIAMALARQGYRIAVHVNQDLAAGNATAQLIRDAGSDAMVYPADLSDPAAASTLIRQVQAESGRLDIVVNNAAIRPNAAFESLDFAQWRAVMSVCLDAAFLVTKASLPLLKQSDRGCIVNIGGLTGHTGAVHRAHVVAAKAGLVGLTKALAHELTPMGITVNCVAPGSIDTDGTSTGRTSTGKSTPVHRAKRTSLSGRKGTVEEVAEAVVFLCGHNSRYITGQTLHVNGGTFLP